VSRIAVVEDDELVQRLADSLGVSPSEAARVVGEVVAHFHEPIEDYVRRRHESCRRQGIANPQAYALIAAEAAGRVVAAPSLTERQVRRIIYG
jgi:hypothetical protein